MGMTLEELYTIVQQPDELLGAYIKRFSKAIAKLSNCHDTIALFALKKRLLQSSNFLKEICSQWPGTIVEALARAQGMIEVEELEKMTRMEQYNHSCQASSFFKSKKSSDWFGRRDRGRTEARSRED